MDLPSLRSQSVNDETTIAMQHEMELQVVELKNELEKEINEKLDLENTIRQLNKQLLG